MNVPRPAFIVTLIGVLTVKVSLAADVTGIDEDTPLHVFGPLIVAVSFVSAIIVTFIAVRKFYRHDITDVLKAEEGQQILQEAARKLLEHKKGQEILEAEVSKGIKSRENEKVIEMEIWRVLRGEDGAKWIRTQVSEQASTQVNALIPRLDSLTKALSDLTPQISAMAMRLDVQQQKFQELEKKLLEDKIQVLQALVPK